MHSESQCSRRTTAKAALKPRALSPKHSGKSSAIRAEVRRGSRTNPDSVDGRQSPKPEYAKNMLAEDAQMIARHQLAVSLPRRWRHSRAVAKQASRLGPDLFTDPADLVVAAWLHDIGYAPQLVVTGLHALDGARYLRTLGVDPVICSLVAHHSAAIYEAGARGLEQVLDDEFPPAPQALSDALWYCDMVTGPDGSPTTLDDRLAEIRRRYGEGHVVTSSLERAESELVGAIRRTEERLSIGKHPLPQPM